MPGSTPQIPKPVGATPVKVARRAIWDMLFGGKFPFIDTDTVKWSRSGKGYAAHSAPARGGGKSATSQIRGEWSNTVGDYVTGNIVFLSTGEAAGTYYALQAVPTGTSPETGAPYWAAFPMPAVGSWST